WVLRLGGVIFLVGTFAAFGIPRAKQIGKQETVDERQQLHIPSIVVAGTAMALLRGVVGFFTFFAAFELKKAGEPAYIYGLVIIPSAIGGLIGVLIAPLLRRKTREEWVLAGALLVPTIPLVYAARNYGRISLMFAAAAVAASAACGRLAFDSL